MSLEDRLNSWIYWFILLYCLLFAVSVPLANFALDAAALLLFFRFLSVNRKIECDRNLFLIAGVFLLFCLISAWNGYDRAISLQKTWQVGYNMLFPFILASYAVKTREKRKTLLVLSSISLAVACIVEVWQGIHGLGSEGAFLGRLQLAAQILLIYPLLVLGAAGNAYQRRSIRIWLLFVAILATSAISFTKVRGAWGAFAVCLILSLFVARVKLRYKIGFLTVTLLLAAGLIIGQPQLKASFESGVTLQAQSVTERFLMWKSAWVMFKDHPGLGIGLGNFGDLYEQKYILPEAKEGRHPHPHNIYLQTLAEVGIFSFAAFTALWAYAIKHLVSNSRKSEDYWSTAVTIGVLGFLLYGITDNVVYHFPAGFQFCWFLIGSSWWRSGDDPNPGLPDKGWQGS